MSPDEQAPSHTSTAGPLYRAELFVNRDAERELVVARARALSLEEPQHYRTIVFRGYKGSGRTWLLRKLAQELHEVAGVKAQYIDLEQWTGFAPKQALREIVGQVEAQCQAWLNRSHARDSARPDSAFPSALPPHVRDLLREHVFVLLLDHVYESDRGLLEQLEESYLALLAVEPRVLFVVAGRGDAYLWKTPELRLYTEEHHLEPLDEEYTREQLLRQKEEAAPRTPEIYRISCGYPLSNYLLADQPASEAMKSTVDGLLEGVPRADHDCIKALCVLRAFNEDHIGALLAAYAGVETMANWSYREERQARDRLLQTRMVRWSEQHGGWQVDGAIRPVLEQYLLEAEPDAWLRLHCAAFRLHVGWANDFPDERQRWLEEARYHAGCLALAGKSPEFCA